MRTLPVRISLVGAVMAAALAVGGCGDNNVSSDKNISKFDTTSDQMSLSAWNIPTNLVNTYDSMGSITNTANGTTTTSNYSNTAFYGSFRKNTAYGENGGAAQAINVVCEDGFWGESFALGRDGAIYGQWNNEYQWEVAFPAGITLDDSWVYDSSSGAPANAGYYDYTGAFISGDDLYYEYPSATDGSITYQGRAPLIGVTVAKITDTNASSGSYTGLAKVVYTRTFRPESLKPGAVTKGLELYTYSDTMFWKPGVGAVSWVRDYTTPNYIQDQVTGLYSVTGSSHSVETWTLTASGVPANNG